MMKINAVLGKSFYSLAIVFRLFGHGVIATGVAIALCYGFGWVLNRESLGLAEAFLLVFSNRIYQLVILFLLFVNFRTMMYRMSDKEV
jgi:hypothetical protein